MYAGRVAHCPLVSHGDVGEYADGIDRQTDRQTVGRTPDNYITLSAGRRGQCNNCLESVSLPYRNVFDEQIQPDACALTMCH